MTTKKRSKPRMPRVLWIIVDENDMSLVSYSSDKKDAEEFRRQAEEIHGCGMLLVKYVREVKRK